MMFKIKIILRLILGLASSFISFNCYATFTIYPVDIRINENLKTTIFTVQNSSEEVKLVQVEVYKVENQQGKEILIETKDIIALPALVKIQGNKKKQIRIAIINDICSRLERGYKLVLRELPPGSILRKGVKFVTHMKVPITVVSN